MTDIDKIHDEVSTFYAKAVDGVANPGGCCGGTSSRGVGGQASYDADAVSDVPDDAIASSFGCGNPVAFSGVHEGDVVVDLGSGAGIDVIIAAGKVGPRGHVIGVDMTGAMIERARANIAEAGFANAEIREGLIEALPIDDASADWVISNCVINLSPDKPAVFAEIARVLKSGGEMLVSDIVVEDLPDWVRQNKALYSACVAGAISEADYIAGLEAAGLASVEVRDRLVYDDAQVEAMYRDEAADQRVADSVGDETIARAAQAATGKVASISVYARKP